MAEATVLPGVYTWRPEDSTVDAVFQVMAPAGQAMGIAPWALYDLALALAGRMRLSMPDEAIVLLMQESGTWHGPST